MRLRSSFYLPFLVAFSFLASSAIVSGQTGNDAERAGAALYRDKGCAFCHGADLSGGKKGPALTGLPKVWTPEKLTDQILNGGKKMPPFRDSVTDEEVSDLIAWLRAKDKSVPPPASTGAAAPAPTVAGP